MTQLQVFSHEKFGEVRTVQIGGEPWFVLKDVCEAMEISNSRMVAERLEDDELVSAKLTSGGQLREMQAINEKGLYRVIFRSDKQEAKLFQNWVFGEVLPTVRKTGGYNQSKQIFRLAAQVEKLTKILETDQKGSMFLCDPWGRKLSANDMVSIEFWEALLFRWRDYRSGSNKGEADEKFLHMIKQEYPQLKVSLKTLYRRWAKYQKGGRSELASYAGRHTNHYRNIDQRR